MPFEARPDLDCRRCGTRISAGIYCGPTCKAEALTQYRAFNTKDSSMNCGVCGIYYGPNTDYAVCQRCRLRVCHGCEADHQTCRGP